MNAETDVVVVGGGIVGIATARALAKSRPDVSIQLLEKENQLGVHQTGHNSGVIHSGIYYEPGSLKAELCRQGSRATKELAAHHHVPVVECGKLLVATSDADVERLNLLGARASRNGIEAECVTARELKQLEPNVDGLAALLVPAAAITDYRALAAALAQDGADLGVGHRPGVEVTNVEEHSTGVHLHTTLGSIRARHVVFCGGIQADRLARMCGLETDFSMLPFRGEYYDVVASKAAVVARMIYPVPDPALPFLGVHLTPTVDGGLTVGPNAVLGLAREGYPKGSVAWPDLREMLAFPGLWRVARQNLRTGAREVRNSIWKAGYVKECQKYCPSLEGVDLTPREAGIRAQAVMRDGTLVHDFLLRSTARTLHVINAPSPAATSALPIGERIAAQVTAILL